MTAAPAIQVGRQFRVKPYLTAGCVCTGGGALVVWPGIPVMVVTSSFSATTAGRSKGQFKLRRQARTLPGPIVMTPDCQLPPTPGPPYRRRDSRLDGPGSAIYNSDCRNVGSRHRRIGHNQRKNHPFIIIVKRKLVHRLSERW